MKILILANKLPFPPRDGGSIATLQMLLGLQQAGNELSCLAMNTAKHSFPPENIPQDLQSSIRFHVVNVNTAIRPFGLALNFVFSNKPYIAKRFHFQRFRKALLALLHEETYDIIQLEGPYLSWYFEDIRKFSAAHIVLRAHNLEHLIWQKMSLGESSLLKRWYLNNLSRRLRKFELSLAGRVDCLVPISEKDAVYFREQGIDTPMLTIPTGLNLKEYPFKKSTSSSTIFFIGSLDWLPNQEGLAWFLDEVFDKLLEAMPHIQLHVAGRNASPRFLKKLEHRNITFHGEVDDAKAFMQKFGIMVAPLFSGSGIRIKILEAMALGRPVVTTSTGIEGIPAENLPSVLVSDDPLAYGELLLKLIRQHGDQSIGMDDARNLISKEFDILELSKRLHQFYKAQA